MTAPPSARTFVAGETEVAAYMNSVSAAINFLLSPPRCAVFNSTAPTLTSGANTTLSWDSEQYDSDNMHNPTTNPTRLTATTSGLYHVQGQCDFGNNATGFRQVAILLNGTGTGFETATGASGGAEVLEVSKDIFLNAGDYLELQVIQSSGANLAIVAGYNFTFFQARWVANS